MTNDKKVKNTMKNKDMKAQDISSKDCSKN